MSFFFHFFISLIEWDWSKTNIRLLMKYRFIKIKVRLCFNIRNDCIPGPKDEIRNVPCPDTRQLLMQISAPEISLLKFPSNVEETQPAFPCFRGARQTNYVMLHNTTALLQRVGLDPRAGWHDNLTSLLGSPDKRSGKLLMHICSCLFNYLFLKWFCS